MKKLLIYIIMLLISPFLFAQDIEWMDLNDAVNLSKTNKKITFIYIPSRGCEYSYKMDHMIFPNDSINTLLSKFNIVRFEAEYRKPYVFQGEKYENSYSYSQNGRTPHSLVRELLDGDIVYPAYVFMIGDEKYKLYGFLNTYDMYTILLYMGDGIYKNKSWKDYKKELENEED